MKQVTFILLLFFTTIGLHAQQTIKSESVSPFNTVSLSGNISVNLIPSDTAKVEIKLSGDADIAKFKWGVVNRTLSASLRAGQGGKGHAEITIYYADTLNNISVSGGELVATEPIVADMLKIAASGGAKVNVAAETMDVEFDVTGNSVAQFAGITKYMTLRATEKSKADTRMMDCLSADVETATGAEVYVSVGERLVANAKTTSTIFYKGKPDIFKNITSRMNAGMMGSSVLNIGE